MIVKAKYSAKMENLGTIKMDSELPIDLHKLVVWVMTNQEHAAALLPEYNRIRGDLQALAMPGREMPHE